MSAEIKLTRKRISAAVGLALLLPACAVDKETGAQSFAGIKVSDDPCANTATVAGAVIGAVVGGVIAKQASRRTDAKVAGIAAGAAIGGLIGRDIDRRRCELFKIAKKHNVEVTIAPVEVPEGPLAPPGGTNAPTSAANSRTAADTTQASGGRSVATGLTIAVRDSGRQFEPGSDQLLPQARAYFAEVAEQYSYGKQAARLSTEVVMAPAFSICRRAAASVRSDRLPMASTGTYTA